MVGVDTNVRRDASAADGARPPRIVVPAMAVVALIGPSGSGKSTFARRHFAAAEIFSSDAFRASLTGREADQGISVEAFAALYAAAATRLAGGATVVIDATNLALDARGQALDLAWSAACPAIAVAFDLPVEVCLAWNEARTGRQVAAGVVRRQHRFFQRSLPHLGRDGFDVVHLIQGIDELSAVAVWHRRRPRA